MAMRRLVLLFLIAGCGSDSTGGTRTRENEPDAGMPPDLEGVPEASDLGAGAGLAIPRHPGGEGDGGSDGGFSISDAAPVKPPVSDGGGFGLDGGADAGVTHNPTPISTATLLSGVDVLDVSVDQGGGVWAVSSSTVYYFAPGRATPYTYDQRNGLARGQYQWTDTWFEPGTYPVTFSSVAGATSGQAIIGNFGTIADRVQVNPSTGAITRLDNMAVTMAQVSGSEYPEHVKRVVAVWKTVVDLNGTFNGTAYLGGFHGFYAFHGLDGDCNCLAFEEHQHYITDSSIGGDDVKGLAISAAGDVFQGDRDFVTLLPQRSKGPSTDFFAYDYSYGLDVFPGVRDEVTALAADASDGLYVASDGNGLAYLAPATHAATYWSTANKLPQNYLRGVAVDKTGDVWVGTNSAGIARLRPSTGGWTYYTQASGLPSNDIRALYLDKLTGSGKVYIATDNGIAIATP
jgi:hypothetical protein